MLAVAGRLRGLHAQVLSPAELTAWTRLDGMIRSAVPGALREDRTLPKPGPGAARSTSFLPPGCRCRAALDSRLMTREEPVREVVRITGSAAFGSNLSQLGHHP